MSRRASSTSTGNVGPEPRPPTTRPASCRAGTTAGLATGSPTARQSGAELFRSAASAAAPALRVGGQRATRAATTDYPSGFLPSWNDGGPDSGIAYLPTIEPTGLNPADLGGPETLTNVSGT